MYFNAQMYSQRVETKQLNAFKIPLSWLSEYSNYNVLKYLAVFL